MKNFLIPLILLIAISSIRCTHKKSDLVNQVEADNKLVTQMINFPQTGEDILNVSYFADTVLYVPLETTPESLIDRIRQVWINDTLIIVNSYKADLMMFSIDGKFIRKIGKTGRGPGEYGSIFHFDVIHDTVYISCSGKRGFIRYTFAGSFCDEIQLKYQPVFFSTTSDQKLACYDKHEGLVYIYNKGFHKPDTIVVEYGVTKGRYRWVHGEPIQTHLQKSPIGLLFSDYMNDTVWNITGNTKEPAYILNLNNKLPRDKQIEFSNGNFKEWDEMAKNYSFVHLYPLSSWMFIIQKVWGPTSGFEANYVKNLTTGEFKRFNRRPFFDDIVSKQFLYTTFFTYSEEYLVAIGSGIIQRWAKEDMKSKTDKKSDVPNQRFLDQMQLVDDADNPVIAFIKLKRPDAGK